MSKHHLSWAKNIKVWLALQAVALVAGNFVGWTTILREVDVFCAAQGNGLWSLTSFSGTAVRNPLLSACFWGSIVFALTFAWTVWLLLSKDVAYVKKQSRRLWWVLLGGTLFALANNVPIFWQFYHHPTGGVKTACSPNGVRNPYVTSCFLGLSAFASAFVFSTLGKYLAARPAPAKRAD